MLAEVLPDAVWNGSKAKRRNSTVVPSPVAATGTVEVAAMNGVGDTPQLHQSRPRSDSEPHIMASSSLRLSLLPWGGQLDASLLPLAAGVAEGLSQQQPATAAGSRQGLGQRGTRGKSCQAIIQAVSSLYRLDDFVKEEIGHGFFSDVYKVTHKVTGDIMVLKMNTSSNNRPNVLREVQLLNKLQHPNILRLLGVCVHEGQLHALTEYINTGSLEQLLADKSLPLSWTLRVSLAADIARGMRYLHSRGFMHRDLTSKNILIQDRGNNQSDLYAVVADLGLATKIPDPLNEAGKQLPVVGSPWWMAPECIHGKRYSERADVFSYGIILCEVIARIESDPDILPRSKNFGLDYIAFSEKVQTSNCPLDFLQMALTCCKYEPRERLSFIQIVATLEELLLRPLDVVTSTSSDTDNAPEASNAGITNGVPAETPLGVGQVVSSSDRHYTPYTKNPFHERFRHYTKLTGCSMENWMYWCDSASRASVSSSLDNLATPPGSPVSFLDTVDEWDYYAWSMTPRGSVSLPSSPDIGRREPFFDRESAEVFGEVETVPSREPLPSDSCFEDMDAKSDISVDSALELESLLHGRKHLQNNIVNTKSKTSHKHEPDHEAPVEQIEHAFRRFGAVRHPPALVGDQRFNEVGRDSPESLLSADESSVWSPTSSFSSCGGGGEVAPAADFSLTRSQWEKLEQRKRQREKFLELVRRWEMKQPAVSSKLTARVAAVHVPTRKHSSGHRSSCSSTRFSPASPEVVSCVADGMAVAPAVNNSSNAGRAGLSVLGQVERRLQNLVGKCEPLTPSFKLSATLPWKRMGSLQRKISQTTAALKSSSGDCVVTMATATTIVDSEDKAAEADVLSPNETPQLEAQQESSEQCLDEKSTELLNDQ